MDASAPGDPVAVAQQVAGPVRPKRLDDAPAAARSAAQPLAQRLVRERPDRGPDHEVVAVDQRDRPAGQADDPAHAIERLVKDLVEVELARGGRCDLDDQPGGRLGAERRIDVLDGRREGIHGRIVACARTSQPEQELGRSRSR